MPGGFLRKTYWCVPDLRRKVGFDCPPVSWDAESSGLSIRPSVCIQEAKLPKSGALSVVVA